MRFAVTFGVVRAMEQAGRADAPFECTVGGACESDGDIAAREVAGVSRLVVSPWQRSREALDGMEAFARRFALAP